MRPLAVISKERRIKDDAIRRAYDAADGDAAYIGPRVHIGHVGEMIKGMRVVAHEDFTKRDVYLQLVGSIGQRTTLILENVARYTKLTAQRFTFLHRLRKMVARVVWVDVAPFAEDITKLYLPYSYLDRQILQYAHGYAFEYNYLEEQADGSLVQSHDLRYLAKKVQPYTRITYGRFMPALTEIVDAPMTDKEHAAYQIRKRELFDKYVNPHRIVTYLCDWINTRQSRHEKLAEVLARHDRTAVYTNIAQNNTIIRKALRELGVSEERGDLRTYRTHDCKPIDADAVALFEAPIVNRYLSHDVLADVPASVPCYVFRGDSKADKYIYGELAKELNTINRFTTELKRIQDACVPTEIRA